MSIDSTVMIIIIDREKECTSHNNNETTTVLQKHPLITDEKEQLSCKRKLGYHKTYQGYVTGEYELIMYVYTGQDSAN